MMSRIKFAPLLLLKFNKKRYLCIAFRGFLGEVRFAVCLIAWE